VTVFYRPDMEETPAGLLSEPQVMPSNPKQFYGDTKIPLHLFPTTAIALGSMALLDGREKYGTDNYRASPVEVMTYVGAALRHLLSYAEGRDTDEDSGLPELAHALACLAILVDAGYAGSLIDNRKFPGGFHKAMAEMRPLVQKIKDTHAKKNPKHYTIQDAR